jgi:hypothetical protein
MGPGLAVIGGSSGSDTAGSCFMGLFSGNCSMTEANVALPIPRAGTISNFFFQTFTKGASGVTITLDINGVPTAITCVTDSDGNCSSTNTATIGLAQTVTIHVGGNTTKQASWVAQLQ